MDFFLARCNGWKTSRMPLLMKNTTATLRVNQKQLIFASVGPKTTRAIGKPSSIQKGSIVLVTGHQTASDHGLISSK